MEVVFTHCAGLAVYNKTIIACSITPGTKTEDSRREFGTFSTKAAGLLALFDWLESHKITYVALKIEEDFWQPVYNLLKAKFEVLAVDSQLLKNLPGSASDRGAEWIAELLRHNMLRGSFTPPLPHQELRDLTLQRSASMQEKVSTLDRLQQLFEWAKLNLPFSMAELTKVSVREVLSFLLHKESKLELDDFEGKKWQELKIALKGKVSEEVLSLITNLLTQLDTLEAQLEDLETKISLHLQAQSITTQQMYEALRSFVETKSQMATTPVKRASTPHTLGEQLYGAIDKQSSNNVRAANNSRYHNQLNGVGRRKSRQMQKYVFALVGVWALFAVGFSTAYLRVGQSKQFAGQPVKSMNLAGQWLQP